MSDSASNRAAEVDSQAVFAALDKVVAETPLAGKREQHPRPDVETAAVSAVTVAKVEPAKVDVVPKPTLRVVALAPKAEAETEHVVPPAAGALLSLPEQGPALFAEHTVERKYRVALRRIPAAQMVIAALTIIAVTEFVLLASKSGVQEPAPPASVTGIVAVESTPAGATIAIDGQPHGTTPSTLTLSPGKYAMAITSGDVTRDIPLVVRAGNNSEWVYFGDPQSGPSIQNAISGTKSEDSATPVSAPAAVPPANAVGGWLSVTAPLELQLFENGALIGSSQSDRIMLPVGRHVIEAINTSLGYKTTSTVQVLPGSVARFSPEMPNGTLNVNATPWADVTIDGKPLGPTPLGNVSLRIGPHDVVFTHPQLGERRQAILVTLNGVNRLSVNLNQR
jgi:hypothetical protein